MLGVVDPAVAHAFHEIHACRISGYISLGNIKILVMVILHGKQG